MKKYKYKPKPTFTSEQLVEQAMKKANADVTSYANQVAKKKPTPKKSMQEIRHEVNKAVKEANRRIKRLEKSGKAYQSQAYRKLQEEKGQKPRFEVKGRQTKESIKQAMKEVKSFTNKKSSTLGGTQEIVAKQREALEKQGITFESESEEKEFFELFGDFMSKSKQRGKKQYNSFQIKQLMYDSYKKQISKYGHVDKTRLYNNVRAKVRYWEQQQELEEQDAFERLTDRRKEAVRTRPSRSR